MVDLHFRDFFRFFVFVIADKLKSEVEFRWMVSILNGNSFEFPFNVSIHLDSTDEESLSQLFV